MKIFLDTNVLVYWVDSHPFADRVEALLAQDCVISVQVLNEFANVLRKKRGKSWADIEELTQTLLDTCAVCDLTVPTHQLALQLAARYDINLYDANIVAAAGLMGCDTLYSEDMQHSMNIRLPQKFGSHQLSIKNPFL